MRISDWSSDVCSSDLKQEAAATLNAVLGRRSDAPLATPDEAPRLVVHSASLAEALDGPDAHPSVRSQQVPAESAHTTVVLVLRYLFPYITVGVGSMQLFIVISHL